VDGLKILMNLKSGLVSRLLSLDRGELIFGDKAEEGVRRALCDMTLLLFHLVLSSFTFDSVDISVASKILKWNLKRYPNGIPILCYPRIHLNALLFLGVFFLFGAGRLSLCRSLPEQAIKYYSQAMRAQSQYRNLHHISNWEIAMAHLSLWDIKSSLSFWTELEKESTVSE
jgi:TPR repeat protein